MPHLITASPSVLVFKYLSFFPLTRAYEKNSSKRIPIMSSPIPLLLLLPPLILLLSSSMINFCNPRQLGLSHKGHCKMKSFPAEIKMKQERTLHGEVIVARGACIEQKTDVAVNEVQGRTSDAISGAENIRFLYTVSSGKTSDKAKEHESAEYHLDYIGPQIHPPTHY